MVQTAEAKQVCRAASTVLFPALEFGVKPCGKYTREDFRESLSRIAFDQEFANTGGKTLQLDRDEHVDITATARNSLAKSLLYHLCTLPADAITDQFDSVRDRLFEVLRSQRRLPAFVDVAIDLHEWRFYGSADTDHVLTTYPDLGTKKRFASQHCVSSPLARDLRLRWSRWTRMAFAPSAKPFAPCSRQPNSTSPFDTSTSTVDSTKSTSLQS